VGLIESAGENFEQSRESCWLLRGGGDRFTGLLAGLFFLHLLRVGHPLLDGVGGRPGVLVLCAWLWKKTLFVRGAHSARERSGGTGILDAVGVALVPHLVLKDIQEREDRLLR
jgi:hypothetical protein